MKNTTHRLTSLSKDNEEIKIGIARTPEEKRAIYRLRYNIYGEEISFNLMSVDHENKLFYDEMDEWAILLYAKVGSNLIGTARINVGDIEKFSPTLVETYHMNKFKNFYEKDVHPNFAVISKGMITPRSFGFH